ncbi:MAG: twin-arginine translocation signal domain-containing protein [Chloroflexota bacterium]
MSKNNLKLSRRRFLSMSAAAGGAAFLAACGGQTAAPSTTSQGAAGASSAAGGDGIEVMVKDVLNYQLSSDEWTGDFGSVTFRLHEGLVNGESIYFIRTDASDANYAQAEGMVFVPLLNSGSSFANNLFVMPNGAPSIMQYGPGDAMFSSLFRVNNVTVNDSSIQLGSMSDVEAAAADGAISLEETPVFVNHPIIRWPGGELTTDSALERALENGQLFAPCDTEKMEVMMKLHQCYPGSRYIVTDTSMAGMAPMMNINASEITQGLRDSGGTDEIWVFGTGIPGPGVMGFQPAIFDNKAGDPVWSPFWDHYTVVWTDESQARVLKSSAEIRELIESGDLEEFAGVPDTHPNGFVVNCPAPILAPNDFEA